MCALTDKCCLCFAAQQLGGIVELRRCCWAELAPPSHSKWVNLSTDCWLKLLINIGSLLAALKCFL